MSLKYSIKKPGTLFLSLLFLINSFGQVLSPEVYSTAGAYYQTNNFSMSITIGEPVINTYVTDGLILTQGFQQPFPQYVEHQILITPGWSGISTYVNPANALVENIFAPVVSDLVIVMGQVYMYWPDQGINTLINWNTHTGYKINVLDSVIVTISGTLETEKIIPMPSGWNFIPVLSINNVVCTDLFTPLGDTLTIVKEIAGTGLYWPDQGIFSLSHLIPGKGYQLHIGHACSLSYACTNDGIGTTAFQQEFVNNTSWNNVIFSPNSHIVAIDKKVLEKLHIGDVIGVFTQQGWCSGMVEITGRDNNMGLTAFGDDPITVDFQDGFAEHELMKYRLFRPAEEETYELTVTYDNSLPNTGWFAMNGLSKILELDMVTSIDLCYPTLAHISVYPNPANDKLIIDYIGTLPDFTQVEFYTLHGKLLKKIPLLQNKTTMNVSNFHRGIYFVKISNSKTVAIRKVVLE